MPPDTHHISVVSQCKNHYNSVISFTTFTLCFCSTISQQWRGLGQKIWKILSLNSLLLRYSHPSLCFSTYGSVIFHLNLLEINNLAVNTFLASLLYDTNGRIFFLYAGVLCIMIFECFTWLSNSTLYLNHLSFLVYILLPNFEL